MSAALRWRAAGLALLALGALILGVDGARLLRGALARTLLERAWISYRETGRSVRPWPWADTHPIARLDIPRLGEQHVVVEGAFGDALAHGPGHVLGTGPPNGPGSCVLAGHRDGAFRNLGALVRGDVLTLHTRDGARPWEVVGARIVDVDDTSALDAHTGPALVLVTCYPFGSVVPGRERYVVHARLIDGR